MLWCDASSTYYVYIYIYVIYIYVYIYYVYIFYNGINSGQQQKKSLSNMSSIIGPHEGKATG